MKGKTFIIAFVTLFCGLIIFIAGVTFYIDPCFHFRYPRQGIGYDLTDSMERYTNDGIIKNFDYDAVISGTSMTANFKKTEFDELFSLNCIKIPYSGGSYNEINAAVTTALDNNKDVKAVLRCLDYGRINENSQLSSYDEYPTYLYDDSCLNDVNYLLNKEILIKCTFRTLLRTAGGSHTMLSFDEYANWTALNEFGNQSVLSKYKRIDDISPMEAYEDADRERVRNNIYSNAILVAESNPDVTFYYFFSPYSILYFDNLYRTGELEKTLFAEYQAIEMLLKQPNIELYSFNDCFDIVTDLNNYMDTAHYSEEISTMILNSIANKSHLLSTQNWEEYWNNCYSYYTQFDYDNYWKSIN